MTANNIKCMVDKLYTLIGTSYLSKEESDKVSTLLSSVALTQGDVDWLTSLYTRLYSLKVDDQDNYPTR